MQLSGQLSDWSVADLLQIMQVTEKTGSLDISGERSGRILFKGGEIVGAELIGRQGQGHYRGTDSAAIADVLYVLTRLEEGTFDIGKEEGPKGDTAFAVKDVLREVEELQEIENDVAESGLFDAAGIRLIRDLERPITLEPDDWQVLVSLVQPFSFGFLESKMGRGGAVRVLHTLHRLGLADVGKADDKLDWLDDIADGLSPTGDEPTGELEPEEPSIIVEEVEEEEPELILEPQPIPVAHRESVAVRGVSAPASTTLTDGVYDEIRRLRSRAADK